MPPTCLPSLEKCSGLCSAVTWARAVKRNPPRPLRCDVSAAGSVDRLLMTPADGLATSQTTALTQRCDVCVRVRACVWRGMGFTSSTNTFYRLPPRAATDGKEEVLRLPPRAATDGKEEVLRFQAEECKVDGLGGWLA